MLVATFVALPSGADGGAHEGVHGPGLVALIWGTAIGLAIAHWFAFRITASVFGNGKVEDKDVKIGFAQLGAAAVVAALCSIPVLLFDDGADVEAASWVPALIIGIAGYLVARQSEKTRLQSVIVGGGVMILGLAVAAVKNFLAGH